MNQFNPSYVEAHHLGLLCKKNFNKYLFLVYISIETQSIYIKLPNEEEMFVPIAIAWTYRL